MDQNWAYSTHAYCMPDRLPNDHACHIDWHSFITPHYHWHDREHCQYIDHQQHGNLRLLRLTTRMATVITDTTST